MSEPTSDDPFGAPPEPAAPPAQRRAAVILGMVVALAGLGVAVALIALHHHSKSTPGATSASAGSIEQVMSRVRAVPTTTLDAVGGGTVLGPPTVVDDPLLTSHGKPELLYIGAEYCPYCAAERWGMAVALSRFGTLHGVTLTESASEDIDPNTATLDFVRTSYVSDYLSFVPVENEDRDHQPLQDVTGAEDAIWTKYSPSTGRGYPFLDIGNKYLVLARSFDPKVLAGLSQAQIAAKLATAADPVARGIDGTANVLTASICGMTDNQPASICNDPVITDLKARIDGFAARSS
jgi:thiol-disulfide isomerase/thioredoxin